MWNTILIIVYLFVNVIAVVLLVREGSKPYRIWAWLMTIFAFPFVGALVFFFFGLNRRKRKLFDLKKIVDDEQTNVFLEKYQSDIEPRRTPDKDFYLQYGKLVELLTRTNNSPLTYNNKVAILNDGQETFEAIFKACESAKESIYIQYYIYENGELAARFAELFSRKIKQGVKILFSYDALGSWSLTDTYLANLKSMGVEVYPFMPVRFGALARTNYRNHRKILVVDGHIGFTGGINVDDKYIHGDPVLGHWADTHLRIEGMAVNFLKFLFFNDWYFVSGQNLFTPDVLQIMGPIGDTPVQLVASGPDSEHAGILYQYVHLINAAHDYVYIANPYLVPTESLLLALKSSALSGVDVRLVIPENSDSVIIKWTVRAYFETLLDCGVKIYLYGPGFLHSKIILSDDKVCSVGTANLDIRSFEQNFEVNAMIYDQTTTLQLKKQFNGFMEKSRQIDPETYKNRPKWDRTRENLARLVSPLM